MGNAEIKQEIIDILRSVTHIVKVYPFMVAFLQMIVVMSYNFLPDYLLAVVDMAVYSSPLQAAFLWLLSKKLHLCKWHRFECMVPLFGLMLVLIDMYIYTFPIGAAMFNLSLSLMILCCSIVNAYHVFIKPNSRR